MDEGAHIAGYALPGLPGQTAHIAGYGRGFLVAKRPWVNEQKGRDTATVQGGYGTGSHSAEKMPERSPHGSSMATNCKLPFSSTSIS